MKLTASKVKVSNVATLVALAAASAGVVAEEIKSTKKSAAAQVSENLYGDVEARLQGFESTDANGDVQRYRITTLRPRLGTKIMDGRFDINFTQPVNNAQYSAKTTRPRSEVETNLNLVDKNFLSVDIYSYHYLQNNETPYEGYLNLDVKFKRDLNLDGIGKLESSILLEPESALTTQRVPAEITRRERTSGLALAEDEKAPDAEQKETTKAFYTYPVVALLPSALPGFKVGLGAIFANEYKPRYKQIISDDGSSELESDGYSVNRYTQVRYTLSYKFNDEVRIYNQLRQNFNGYMETAHARGQGVHLDNRTGVIVSLF